MTVRRRIFLRLILLLIALRLSYSFLQSSNFEILKVPTILVQQEDLTSDDISSNQKKAILESNLLPDSIRNLREDSQGIIYLI